MENFVVIAVIAAILSGVVFYIRREKKAGHKCIGCPDSAVCSGSCAGCSGCGSAKPQ